VSRAGLSTLFPCTNPPTSPCSFSPGLNMLITFLLYHHVCCVRIFNNGYCILLAFFSCRHLHCRVQSVLSPQPKKEASKCLRNHTTAFYAALRSRITCTIIAINPPLSFTCRTVPICYTAPHRTVVVAVPFPAATVRIAPIEK
jgi:hypothetical protein